MNTTDFYSCKMQNIKKTVKVKDVPVMVININYPFFESCENQGNEHAFLTKLNKFYSHTAEKYHTYICKKYPAKAEKLYNSSGGIKTAFLMNCTVSLNTHHILSVFSDLSYFDGKIQKTVRFSQNWSSAKSALLPASYFFENTSKAKKYIINAITETAEENMDKRDFAYFSDYRIIIRKKFDFDCLC